MDCAETKSKVVPKKNNARPAMHLYITYALYFEIYTTLLEVIQLMSIAGSEAYVCVCLSSSCIKYYVQPSYGYRETPVVRSAVLLAPLPSWLPLQLPMTLFTSSFLHIFGASQFPAWMMPGLYGHNDKISPPEGTVQQHQKAWDTIKVMGIADHLLENASDTSPSSCGLNKRSRCMVEHTANLIPRPSHG